GARTIRLSRAAAAHRLRPAGGGGNQRGMLERRSRTLLAAYVLAALLLTIGIVVRLAIQDVSGATGAPLLFVPAILVGAILGGVVPGLIVTAAATPVVYYFLEQGSNFAAPINLATFAIVGAAVSWVGGSFREVRTRAQESARALQRREAQLVSSLDTVPDATIAIATVGTMP